MFLVSDAANSYSDNMSEQVDVVEIKTEPNEFDELFSVSKNRNLIVSNHSRKNETTTRSKHHISIHLKNKFSIKLYFILYYINILNV